MRRFIAILALFAFAAPAFGDPIKTDLPISADQRIHNGPGGMCVGCSLEDCANYLHIDALRGVHREFVGGGWPEKVRRVLTRRGLVEGHDWEQTEHANLGWIQTRIDAGFPCGVAINHNHMICCRAMDTSKVVCVDNNPAVLRGQSIPNPDLIFTPASFQRIFDGWAVVIYSGPSRTPGAITPMHVRGDAPATVYGQAPGVTETIEQCPGPNCPRPWPWRPRPQPYEPQPQPQPYEPEPGPAPSPAPAPGPSPSPGGLDRLSQLERDAAGLKALPGQVESKLAAVNSTLSQHADTFHKGLQDLAAQLAQAKGDFGGLANDLKSLAANQSQTSQLIPDLASKIQGVASKAQTGIDLASKINADLGTLAPVVSDLTKLTPLAGDVAKLAPLASWSGTLPWMLGGSIGGPLLAAAGMGLSLFLQSRKPSTATASTGATATATAPPVAVNLPPAQGVDLQGLFAALQNLPGAIATAIRAQQPAAASAASAAAPTFQTIERTTQG